MEIIVPVSRPACMDPLLDGCPSCVANTEEPYYVIRKQSRSVAFYKCADCGHRWHTARMEG